MFLSSTLLYVGLYVFLLQGEGVTACKPVSCYNILKDCQPAAESGNYQIANSDNKGLPQYVYCDMTTEHCGVKGGWTRVAHLDMRRASSSTCPNGLQLITSPSRMCRRQATSAGCTSVYYDTYGIEYSRICGRVAGYGCKTADSFRYYSNSRTIDQAYVDGISITHGVQRKHVYTYAADYRLYSTGTVVPFVGTNWLTDTFPTGSCFTTRLFDGEHCLVKHACSLSGQPWFCHTLPVPTKDRIEVRLCRDSDRNNEDIALEQLELYIR